MKPWQSRDPSKQTQAAPVAPAKPLPTAVGDCRASAAKRIAGIGSILKAKEPFLKALARTDPLVCQFSVVDHGDLSWFIELAPHGGNVSWGNHASPSVTWVSDAQAVELLFRGQIAKDRVKIQGNFDALKTILRALAPTPHRRTAA